MVILIGGASCSGKTFLAQKLLEKYKFPYFSIDHIKMGLIRTNRSDGLTPYDDDKLTSFLWPIIREIIKTNIENKQSIIIEGCYLPQSEIHSFEDKYQKHIIALYLVFSNKYIDNNFSTIINNSSIIEEKEDLTHLTKEYLYHQHSDVFEKCIEYKAPYILIDNNFIKDTKKAFTLVDKFVENN
ncbi:MAG: AAA family ATPase [Candidatus Izimaplasma sp.]|nr:AAA family ATPase [Candidatus Izimaplasma bacterium]